MISLEELNLKYVTDKKGNKKEVILPIADFETLIEDLEDLAIVAERRDEETISHEDIIKELKSDGII